MQHLLRCPCVYAMTHKHGGGGPLELVEQTPPGGEADTREGYLQGGLGGRGACLLYLTLAMISEWCLPAAPSMVCIIAPLYVLVGDPTCLPPGHPEEVAGIISCSDTILKCMHAATLEQLPLRVQVSGGSVVCTECKLTANSLVGRMGTVCATMTLVLARAYSLGIMAAPQSCVKLVSRSTSGISLLQWEAMDLYLQYNEYALR